MKTSKILFAVIILSFNLIKLLAQPLSLTKVQDIPFEFHKITDIRNGYTLQSNASPQQLWLDLNNPEFLHAVFINSQFKETPFSDRTCLYFGSTDFGQYWFELGPVPDTSRAGSPSIYGTGNGTAIIANQSDYFGLPTRTGLFIDNSPFEYNFTAYDPDSLLATNWPKCIVIPDGNILIASLALPSDSLVLNTFDPNTGTFSGWIIGETSRPEAYSFSISDFGKIGFAFICGDGVNEGDVNYFESADNGITWSLPIKIFDCPSEQGVAIGALRGISLNFYGEEPCVVFEVCQQDFNSNNYFPRLPNQILFWSPNINGGVTKVIADSSRVAFSPSLNPADVFPPLCRPVIGRSDLYNFLFVAFSASTENVYVGTDSVTYFAGYFDYSTDGGQTWLSSEPQKFTPEFTLLDWKYISGLSVYPVIEDFPNFYLIIHYVLQADSIEENPNPQFLSAKYYHSSSEPLIFDIFGVNEDASTFSDFRLEQNYPNPFNPSTSIKYLIPHTAFVQLKVYDVLGNEITNLVSEEKQAGSYEVVFNASEIPSGVYFYTLKSGDFIQSRKLVLLK